MSTTEKLSDEEVQRAKREYAESGYFILRNVVPRELVSGLHEALAAEFTRVSQSGELFSGGGLLSGHLNCFPGAGARPIYEVLQARGVIDLIKELHPRILRLPNLGCNFNLPGSHAQHWHTDRPFNRDFMICNVTLVDTTEENGATDIVPGTHREFYKYTRFFRERPDRNSVRVISNRGDVVVRNSNTWHRGMSNRTDVPRPMLAFTWEDGGSVEPDPFNINGGRIRFHPNWFRLTPAGRLRERLFVKVPAAYTALRLARSLVDRDY